MNMDAGCRMPFDRLRVGWMGDALRQAQGRLDGGCWMGDEDFRNI